MTFKILETQDGLEQLLLEPEYKKLVKILLMLSAHTAKN